MLTKWIAALRYDPAIWAIAALSLVAHAAVAGRYDFFRNELYYIVCGRHPAFGYADQPPLVPLLAAATQIFGLSAWLLRLPAALAAASLVPLTAAFARLLGGTTQSAILAALAAAIAPALIALTQIMTTSTFEPLAWTAAAYLIARAAILDDRRALLWAGLATGIAMQAKIRHRYLARRPARRITRHPGTTNPRHSRMLRRPRHRLGHRNSQSDLANASRLAVPAGHDAPQRRPHQPHRRPASI
jgi:hypothetical protein